jgi:hypothetical protein
MDYFVVHFICYGKESASSSVSDADRYVIIRKLLHSNFNIAPVSICQEEIQTYIGFFFLKVTYTRYDVTLLIDETDFMATWTGHERRFVFQS